MIPTRLSVTWCGTWTTKALGEYRRKAQNVVAQSSITPITSCCVSNYLVKAHGYARDQLFAATYAWLRDQPVTGNSQPSPVTTPQLTSTDLGRHACWIDPTGDRPQETPILPYHVNPLPELKMSRQTLLSIQHAIQFFINHSLCSQLAATPDSGHAANSSQNKVV